MAAWLLTISKDFPQHWDYAKEHGVWDLITPRQIKAGDTVYFWQSGASLLGKVRATEDAWTIDPGSVDAGPWDDWPGAPDKPYRSRFHLEVLAPSSVEQPTWHAVAHATGLSKNPTFVRTLRSEQQAVLDDLIGGEPLPEQTLDDARREQVMANLDEDLRVRRLQLIALRQGQPRFRNALLDAYSRTCAISGTEIPSVLEAAHISPHLGEHTNIVPNGLLLRADLHTLFDLYLITIDARTMRVRVAPELLDSDYGGFQGQPLAVTPARLTEQPSLDYLSGHNDKCGWLSA